MGKLSPSELATIGDDVAEQATRLALRLTGDQWAQGCRWYPDAHVEAATLAARSSVSVDVAASVLAVLSPRQRWPQTVHDAGLIFDGDRFSGFAALGLNVLKAGRIADGTDPDVVLGGRKVRSFRRNISEPTLSLDVTIDVWFLRHVVPSHYLDRYTVTARFYARVGVYDAISDGTRSAAEGFSVLPHQLQAALWIQAHEEAGASLD